MAGVPEFVTGEAEPELPKRDCAEQLLLVEQDDADDLIELLSSCKIMFTPIVAMLNNYKRRHEIVRKIRPHVGIAQVITSHSFGTIMISRSY